MLHRLCWTSVLTGLVLLAGCSLPRTPQVDMMRYPDPPTAEYAPALWSLEGLEGQPRLAAYEDLLPPESSLDPGTTAWHEAPHPTPVSLSSIGQRYASPGALLVASLDALSLMDSLGQDHWEQTQRIWQEEDRAIGIIMLWGYQDDAVRGRDYRLWMREDRRGWFIESLETRYHCGRGVQVDGTCL